MFGYVPNKRRKIMRAQLRISYQFKWTKDSALHVDKHGICVAGEIIQTNQIAHSLKSILEIWKM